MDVRTLVDISTEAARIIKRKLSDRENKLIVYFIRSEFTPDLEMINTADIRGVALNFVNNVLHAGVNSNDGVNSNVDGNIHSVLGIESITELTEHFNPTAHRKTAYMCLDSRYADFSPDCTKLTWNITNTLIEQSNSVNVIGQVRDICSIRMLSIVVRKFNSISGRASILIEELSAQSFSFPNNRKFHFVGLLNDLENPAPIDIRSTIGPPTIYMHDFTLRKYELLAGYKFNEGYYRFNKPITTFDTITVSIADPFDLIVLPKYEFINVSIIFSGSNITLTFPEPHNYLPDSSQFNPVPPAAQYDCYSIFIDDFTTSNQIADAVLINTINTMEFTSIQILSGTQILIRVFERISAGATSNPPPIVIIPGYALPVGIPTTARVRFNSHRVIMNFELEYIA